ncbi:MAG: metallophosphoesterase family protein [Candidatus Promineifilaceae bacterium]|jgi:predicted phosphodiesterase
MQQITIFGDIHGNMPALQAVWVEMDRRGLERRFCLGDLVGYGVQPDEVVRFIRDHDVPTLMGNYDQGVGHSSNDCGCAYRTPEAQALGERSIAWSNAHVSESNKAYLRNLPMTMTLMLDKVRATLVHGSPRRINEYLYEDRPESSIERLFNMIGADVIVCGHTHKPYDRALPGGRRLINAGSVGKPKDHDPRAGFVILTVNGKDIQTEFVRVVYDVEQAAQAIEATEMPGEFAVMLREGIG